MALRANIAAHRIADALPRTVLPPRVSSKPSDWMPLGEAARALQAAERNTDLACVADGLSDSDEALLLFWATRLVRAGLPVYGRRIMASHADLIPRDELLSGRLRDAATRLGSGRGEPSRDVCALAVRRTDLDACLAGRPKR